jgi:hypothetical protein
VCHVRLPRAAVLEAEPARDRVGALVVLMHRPEQRVEGPLVRDPLEQRGEEVRVELALELVLDDPERHLDGRQIELRVAAGPHVEAAQAARAVGREHRVRVPFARDELGPVLLDVAAVLLEGHVVARPRPPAQRAPQVVAARGDRVEVELRELGA